MPRPKTIDRKWKKKVKYGVCHGGFKRELWFDFSVMTGDPYPSTSLPAMELELMNFLTATSAQVWGVLLDEFSRQ